MYSLYLKEMFGVMNNDGVILLSAVTRVVWEFHRIWFKLEYMFQLFSFHDAQCLHGCNTDLFSVCVCAYEKGPRHVCNKLESITHLKERHFPLIRCSHTCEHSHV
jgi:hypothetical protein